MEKTLLDLSGKWSLTLVENNEVLRTGFDPKTAAEVRAGGYLTIDGSVPGNFELDLFAAGLAPDPFVGTNPWDYQQYENRHLYYSTTFDAPTCDESKNDLFLVFDGVDTVADIYLNGTLLGHTDNMFVSHEYEVCASNLRKTGNELLVHITPATIASREHDIAAINFTLRYNTVTVRKAAHMFGWDIMPRFVSGGLWKPVRVVERPKERLAQVYFWTDRVDVGQKTAMVKAFFDVHSDRDHFHDFTIEVQATCGEAHFGARQTLWQNHSFMNIGIPNAVFWYPKNAGDPALYDVRVRLLAGDEVLDEQNLRFGIRTIELERTSTTSGAGDGEFVFRVNGDKVFVMGTNWVPLDAFHSRDKQRLPAALELLDDIGCNMVRVWGGNVYEDDAFYDFCDEKGILIWQDFAMGCAMYPQDDAFAAAFAEEARQVICRLRNHAGLALWSGDNEIDMFCATPYRDPNLNRITREILVRALFMHDSARPYLPSSPYYDSNAYAARYSKDPAIARRTPTEVHMWNIAYFKDPWFSNTSGHGAAQFVSETGYYACPSPVSVNKFITPACGYPILDADGKPKAEWQCHAASMEPAKDAQYSFRPGATYRQACTVFGDGAAWDLNAFAMRSQCTQAEALKYFIERIRTSKWRRTGILWWNLVDGWPQVSDAVVDYYGVKKLAYHYIKRTQQPLCFMFEEPKDGKMNLMLANDGKQKKRVSYRVTDVTNQKLVAMGEVEVDADTTMIVQVLPAFEDYHMLHIEWQGDATGSNHYTTKTKDISFDQYLADLKACGYDEFEGF